MQSHEQLARRIQEKLDITDESEQTKSMGYYCAVALKYPENQIWLWVEQAQRGRNKGALFNHLVTKEKRK